MKIENAYRIELHEKRGNKTGNLIQYIEADCMDEAIEKAKNTFEARLYHFEKPNIGSSAQKSCKLRKIHEPLRFGFQGGWYTVHGNGEKTIFEMMREAEADKDFVKGPITEISVVLRNGKRI